jgi:hypothetical protein
MVGALFILLLLVISFGFALTMFTSFTGYQNSVQTRAQFNSAVSQEKLTLNRVVWGATSTYNPAQSMPLTATDSKTPTALYYPIGNMNFTSSSSGWAFTSKYLQGSTGASGNFDPTTSIGSKSGPGDIFMDVYNARGVAGNVQAMGNWTTQFVLSSNQVTSLGVGTPTVAFFLGNNLLVNNPSTLATPVVNFYIQDAVSLTTQTIASSVSSTLGTYTKNSYGFPGGTSAQHTFFKGSSGTYNLIVSTTITAPLAGAGVAEQKLYFDDVGIVLQLSDTYFAAVCPTFTISTNALTGESPTTVKDLTISLDSLYGTPVTQVVYLWNFALSALVQVDTSAIGTTDIVRSIDLANQFATASQIQAFTQTKSASISPPNCPTVPISTVKGSVVMEVYSIAAAAGKQYTLTVNSDALTDYFPNANRFTVVLANPGTATTHFVSLWVTGGTGPTQFASTLTGTSRFDQWVPPGQFVTVTLTFSWSPGTYSLEFVTDKGSVFTASVSAA